MKALVVLGLFLLGSGVARADYGAIAYSSSTGRTGSSWNASCADEAQTLANNYCGTGDCRAIVWVQNGCAAFAIGDGGRYGWAWGNDLATAIGSALTTCSSTTTNCSVSARVCSG